MGVYRVGEECWSGDIRGCTVGLDCVEGADRSKFDEDSGSAVRLRLLEVTQLNF